MYRVAMDPGVRLIGKNEIYAVKNLVKKNTSKDKYSEDLKTTFNLFNINRIHTTSGNLLVLLFDCKFSVII